MANGFGVGCYFVKLNGDRNVIELLTGTCVTITPLSLELSQWLSALRAITAHQVAVSTYLNRANVDFSACPGASNLSIREANMDPTWVYSEMLGAGSTCRPTR